jgi:hypothetical protein
MKDIWWQTHDLVRTLPNYWKMTEEEIKDARIKAGSRLIDSAVRKLNNQRNTEPKPE